MSSQKKPKAIAENVTHVSPLHMYAQNSHNSSINHSVASLWHTHIPTSASLVARRSLLSFQIPNHPISSHRPYFPFSSKGNRAAEYRSRAIQHGWHEFLISPFLMDHTAAASPLRPGEYFDKAKLCLRFVVILVHFWPLVIAQFQLLEKSQGASLPCIGWRPPNGHMSTWLCR